MKELYSIGETAKLMGISVQTLRNYSDMGLFQPEEINEDNGYRYYSFRQFHFIDRIKYLRKMGLPLNEIHEVLGTGSPDVLLDHLLLQEGRIHKEIAKMQDTLDDIQWYIDYFKYIKQYNFKNIPYVMHIPKRYVMYVDYKRKDTVESVETRLAALKNMHDYKYRRQYGYIVDMQHLLEKEFVEEKYFIYLKEKPEGNPEWLMELPAGDYLCFRGRVRTEDWEPSLVAEYFSDVDAPVYAIANEYEDSLVEYHHCPYEVQILLNPKKDH